MSGPILRGLLIDDDLLRAGKVVGLVQGREAFHLEWCESAAVAVERLRKRAFDFLVVSVSDAPSATTALQELVPHRGTLPVVTVLPCEAAAEAEALLADGAVDCVDLRELTPALFERTIRFALHRQRHSHDSQRLLEALQRNRKALRRKNRRLARLYHTAQKFVDNVSHEFRTPLTVIKEYTSLVQEGIVGDIGPEPRRMLHIVEDRADDLNIMVEDLLDVSKLEAGLLGAWRKTSRVNEIVQHVLPSLERKAGIKGVALRCECPTSLPEIYGDAEKVGRVLTNLTINAIKFCGDPGEVRLWVRERPAQREVIFGVTDNGPGIHPSDVPMIFRRFKQLGVNRRGSTKGFGLGLNIAQELVELNLGRLGVDSELGTGSTFWFTVPCADAVEVMRRWLDRVPRDVVSLLEVSAESTDVLDDVDAFLNYLLRKHDLLFRTGPNQWLLAVPATACELPKFLDECQQKREAANRNRPHGLLPELSLTTLGTWPKDRREEFLGEVRNVLGFVDFDLDYVPVRKVERNRQAVALSAVLQKELLP